MEVEPGLVIPADLSDYMILHYFANPFCGQHAVRLARELIQPGDTVLDIGANIGLWSLVAARRVGAGGRLFALEPVPGNFKRLRQALELNRMTWVECRQLALSDRIGSTTFYASTTGNSALGSLARREGIDEPLVVPTTTLDEFCEVERVGTPHFLKVDVEGAEALVFQGGGRTLGQEEAPAIQFEASDPLLRRFGTDTTALKRRLTEFDYRVLRYDGRELAVVPVDEPHEFEDLFALKPSHLARTSSLARRLQTA
jgi:FkbM family methyltransferase